MSLAKRTELPCDRDVLSGDVSGGGTGDGDAIDKLGGAEGFLPRTNHSVLPSQHHYHS